ncbi:MAG: transporter substrate-binding domain-containing protein [Comamonadaceae bacterium]|jgi:polar amino acid transport system substrate-binding protein|nr:transporter substrate-binding domain-containing protein [Comamonadaceae bacterium]
MNTTLKACWWVVCMLAAAAAEAGCSRPISVPMAPVGLSVSFDGDRSGGIYPTLLRELGAASGCEFQIQRVPRARLQRMFDTGQADLLMPASAAPSRDREGEFVPLLQVRASLVTLARDGPLPRSLAELATQPHLKLAVVRGFTYGPAYESTLAALRQQKRLVEESSVAGVARALRQGLAHGTVMTASIFMGTLLQEAELTPLAQQMRVEPLDELGWSESGVYLSRRTLNEADRRHLRQVFSQAARSGRIWQLLNDSHPPGSLSGSIKPLP